MNAITEVHQNPLKNLSLGERYQKEIDTLPIHLFKSDIPRWFIKDVILRIKMLLTIYIK